SEWNTEGGHNGESVLLLSSKTYAIFLAHLPQQLRPVVFIVHIEEDAAVIGYRNDYPVFIRQNNLGDRTWNVDSDWFLGRHRRCKHKECYQKERQVNHRSHIQRRLRTMYFSFCHIVLVQNPG